MLDKKIVTSKLGVKNWALIILLGLAGQIAWNVENSWFNTFVYDTITPAPGAIAWMVAVSAITATVTTLIMGTLSDRIGKRKPFIFFGYILWGLSTVIFPTTALIQITTLAVVMVIIADAVMTFFGSTAYDAAFNAWTTDISDRTNRGLVSSILTILPLIAIIIGSALSGVLIDRFGYFTFFYTLGGLVALIGVIGGLILKDAEELHRSSGAEQGFIGDVLKVFKPGMIKSNRELFLILTAMALFMISIQVFLPYHMIYLNHYLNYSKSLVGIILAAAITIAMLIAIPAGKITDHGYGLSLAITAPLLSFIGLIAFSISKSILLLILSASLIFMGYIVLLLTTVAGMKNLMPEENRGQFEGIRMIFFVALPMIVGPIIGSNLITRFGIATIVEGKAGSVASPLVFQFAAVFCLTTLIPLIIIARSRKQGFFARNVRGGF